MKRFKIDDKTLIIVLLAVVVLMTIGFAAFSTKLNIKGTSSISSNWDVHISNIETKETHGGATDAKTPSWDKLSATLNTNLVSPGDYKIYTITITNGGDLDATLKNIKSSITNNSAIVFNVSGFDEGDDLLAGNSTTMDVKIMYNSNVTSQPSNLESTLKLELNFIQKDNAKKIISNDTYNFDYTGSEQTFTAPKTGTYQLETWGAQGGGNELGGYGAYSTSYISLKENDKLYINVGGEGTNVGGYNGGGTTSENNFAYGGGGATSIAKQSGLLSTFEKNITNLLQVSGAGGGGDNWSGTARGGNGGGIQGNFGTLTGKVIKGSDGGTQINGGNPISTTYQATAGKFGQGGYGGRSYGGGGGSGYYGGGGGDAGSTYTGGGGGGSSYIGNTLLTNKHMTCYECVTSNEESTKTLSVTTSSNMPISDSAKEGNGYARITLIS